MKFVIIFLLFFAAAKTFAQTDSPYSRYGLGDIMENSFGDSKAMGGVSLAIKNPDKLYISNPASYSNTDSLHFIFEVGLRGAFKSLSSAETDNSTGLYDAGIDYLSIGFPITNYIGGAAGILPYSSVGYDLKTSKNEFGMTSNHFYSGSGGINKAFIGASIEPINNLSLGFNANYLFGNINQTSSIRFEDYGMVDITRKNIVYYSDFHFSLGAQYHMKLNDNHAISLGFISDLPANLNSKRSVVVTNALSSSSASIIDTIKFTNEEKGKVSLPMTIGGGISYRYRDILTLAADVKIQDWSDATSFGEESSSGTGTRIGFGSEYIPAGKNSPGLKYFQKVRYRIGGYYNDSYLQLDQGETKINDFGISFGLGLPMKRSKTTIDLSVELGQRGNTENNLVKEQYAILGVNFSLTDIWFIKRKFD